MCSSAWDGQWVQSAFLAPADLAFGDWFGYSLALRGDRALIGAPWTYNDYGPALRGQAYVFEAQPSGWVQTARLQLDTPAFTFDSFGWSVALLDDAALIGAPWAESAHVYRHTPELPEPWSEVLTLNHPSPVGVARFGSAVAADASGLAVGAEYDGAAGDQAGAAFAFPEGPAAETVRLGTPPNPAALLPGQSSPPLLGAAWDPVIDHSAFQPAAVLDLLGVSAAPLELSTPFGTLLCDPAAPGFVAAAAAPGVPFALAVPADCGFVGASLCAQGASLDAAGALALTNALDVTLGSF